MTTSDTAVQSSLSAASLRAVVASRYVCAGAMLDLRSGRLSRPQARRWRSTRRQRQSFAGRARGAVMSIMSRPSRHDGYYDDNGQWRRTKFCFVSCGVRCTCMPPNGQQYSPQHDKGQQRACSCQHSDAWRCAVLKNLSGQITCHCSCHRPTRARMETPADLVGALQDRVHEEAGPYRAARSVKETFLDHICRHGYPDRTCRECFPLNRGESL